jgi:hypothetical protein
MQGQMGVRLRGLVLSRLFYLSVLGAIVFIDNLQAPPPAATISAHKLTLLFGVFAVVVAYVFAVLL